MTLPPFVKPTDPPIVDPTDPPIVNPPIFDPEDLPFDPSDLPVFDPEDLPFDPSDLPLDPSVIPKVDPEDLPKVDPEDLPFEVPNGLALANESESSLAETDSAYANIGIGLIGFAAIGAALTLYKRKRVESEEQSYSRV